MPRHNFTRIDLSAAALTALKRRVNTVATPTALNAPDEADTAKWYNLFRSGLTSEQADARWWFGLIS